MSRFIKDFRDNSQPRSITNVNQGSGGSGHTQPGRHSCSGSTSSISWPSGQSGSDFSGVHTHNPDNRHEISRDPYYGSSPSGVITSSLENLSLVDTTNCSNSNSSTQRTPSPGSSSPQVGRKIAKSWRNMGDKTKTKTRIILKRWQTIANGQAHHRKLHSTPKPEIQIYSEEPSEEVSDLIEEDESSGGRKESKGSWSVHIWSTWVRRPYEDDDDEHPPEGKIYLSDFQVEKFSYYFTDVFDHNKDRVITIADIQALNERMRHYAGWSDDNEYYLTMKEIHSDFFECLLEHVGKIEPEYGFEFDVDRIPDRVEMYQWMNMWGNLTHGAKAMADFPIWLQILPKILFKVINRKDNGVISYEELKSFYGHFIKLKEELVEPMTQEAYAALTSCGDFPLTERVYLMAFANFLLGKTSHGPGKYIFGGFKGSDVNPFQVDYSCLNDPPEE